MATFHRSDDLQGAEFIEVNLRGARFVESDLTGVVMRGVEVMRTDIDAPWLPHGEFFRINGVDVIPFVEAELDRRFPGRAERRAGDPQGLRAAWAVLQDAWAAAIGRAGALPAGAVDESVAGEWSFAQTLRHLVQGIDIWLGRTVLGLDRPFHPLGVAHDDGTEAAGAAPYPEVLEARDSRVAMVRDFLADATADQLDEARENPHRPERPETVRSCLHVLLDEGWEHLRFATRDLEAVAASSSTPSTG